VGAVLQQIIAWCGRRNAAPGIPLKYEIEKDGASSMVNKKEDETLTLGDDKDMLEDLVAAAFNDAVRKAEATTNEKMSGMTAGLPLPPGFKLPF
jgi:hypothetical protein